MKYNDYMGRKNVLRVSSITCAVNLIGVLQMYVRDTDAEPQNVVVEGVANEYGQQEILIHTGWGN